VGTRSKAIEVHPRNGGKLLTSASSELGGLANYTVKRDWRRYLDREMRSEGTDQFNPRGLAVPGTQSAPPVNGKAIIAIAMMKRADGRSAVIVGSEDKLFRFSFYDSPYYTPDTYFDVGYIAAAGADWTEIGSGFSTLGRRWEVVDVNGTLVLNNGYDLPVAYRIDDGYVKPLYQLRDSGIAYVRGISTINGVLLCSNVAQVKPANLPTLLALKGITGITRAGNVATVTTPAAHGLATGDRLTVSGADQLAYNVTRPITVTSSTTFTYAVYNNPATPATGALLQYSDAYRPYVDLKNLDIISYRMVWSGVNDPEDFAPSVNGNTVAGTHDLTLAYPAKWIKAGDTIVIAGAGLNGGNLVTLVDLVYGNGTKVLIRAFANNTVTAQPVRLIGASGSVSGFADLGDDGYPINKSLPIRNVLVVYKERSILLGQFTGSVDAPFLFEQVYQGEYTPQYANAVILVDGIYHVYPGERAFFRFDLVNRQPRELDIGTESERLFYKNIKPSTEKLLFAADNAVTREIFLAFKSSSIDRAIRYDYRFGTTSTTSQGMTAAAMVERPSATLVPENPEEWFLMGTEDGRVLRYGLSAAEELPVVVSQSGTNVSSIAAVFLQEHVGRSILWPDGTVAKITGFTSANVVVVDTNETRASSSAVIIPSVWSRDGQDYDSTLQSCLEGFGNAFDEKKLERYVVLLSSRPQKPTVTVDLLGSVNPTDTPTVLGTRTWTNPQTSNMVATSFLRNYLADRIRVSGKNNPCEITGRIFSVIGYDDDSLSRT
jgi:hypothetical protein